MALHIYSLQTPLRIRWTICQAEQRLHGQLETGRLSAKQPQNSMCMSLRDFERPHSESSWWAVGLTGFRLDDVAVKIHISADHMALPGVVPDQQDSIPLELDAAAALHACFRMKEELKRQAMLCCTCVTSRRMNTSPQTAAVKALHSGPAGGCKPFVQALPWISFWPQGNWGLQRPYLSGRQAHHTP